MKRPRKYGPGEPISTLDELLEIAQASRDGGDGMVWEIYSAYARNPGRVVHASWVGNTSAFRLNSMLKCGTIRRAVVTDEYRAWLAAETEAAR